MPAGASVELVFFLFFFRMDHHVAVAPFHCGSFVHRSDIFDHRPYPFQNSDSRFRVSHFASFQEDTKMDVFAFSAGQFLVCAVLHLVFSLYTEPVTTTALKASWLPLVYAGLFSAAGGFTLQALGQRKAPASDAALLLSLEAVFAALAGVAFLQERMNWIQMVGCGIILVAILFSQLMVTRRNIKDQAKSPVG